MFGNNQQPLHGSMPPELAALLAALSGSAVVRNPLEITREDPPELQRFAEWMKAQQDRGASPGLPTITISFPVEFNGETQKASITASLAMLSLAAVKRDVPSPSDCAEPISIMKSVAAAKQICGWLNDSVRCAIKHGEEIANRGGEDLGDVTVLIPVTAA